MAEREGRHEADDVGKAREEEHHPEQEQEVIVAAQHVQGADLQIFEVAARHEDATLAFRHVVGRGGIGAGREREGDHQEHAGEPANHGRPPAWASDRRRPVRLQIGRRSLEKDDRERPVPSEADSTYLQAGR